MAIRRIMIDNWNVACHIIEMIKLTFYNYNFIVSLPAQSKELHKVLKFFYFQIMIS